MQTTPAPAGVRARDPHHQGAAVAQQRALAEGGAGTETETLGGAVWLCDLTPEVLDEWVGAVSAADGGGERRLRPTSARLVRKVLSMALEEAVERGRLARNPVRLTRPPRPERSRTKLAWTLEEASSFLQAVADHRLYAAFPPVPGHATGSAREAGAVRICP